MPHDFIRFPELTNSQMEFYYLESPHKQITEDFRAEIVKVHDGDTVTLKCDFRDFEFPLRFLGTNAPELSEDKGREVQEWLEDQVLGEEVTVKIDPNQRVGKWGRLLGTVISRGMSVSDMMMNLGLCSTFEGRDENKLPILTKTLNLEQWF